MNSNSDHIVSFIQKCQSIRTWRLVLLAGLLFAILFLWLTQASAANPDGDLRIEVLAAPNLVVDSNVESPSTYAPESATIGAKFCNDGDNPLTDVFAYIGDFDPNGDLDGADSTPGIYPSRTHTGLTGTFSLTHEGGSAGTNDARRYVGTLAPNSCQTQYWVLSYPRLDDNGNTVTGGIKPDDDLWLEYDLWATANDGGALLAADQTRIVTMRNEISAAANKIWPNGDNKVPDIYKDAINEVLGWDTVTPTGGTDVYPGDTAVLQGVWYDLGNVGAGFDNDGDLIPDKNAWMQPVGDPNNYDPGCFRLVRTYGIVIVKLQGGGEYLIPFVDQLYFQDIPDNTGAVGLVFYEYAALDGVCMASLTPYQEVASGFDNEKFNGDYGHHVPPLISRDPTVTLDKQVDQAVVGPTLPVTLTYTLEISNTGPVDVGDPNLGIPLVIQDSIPPGTSYIAGTAAIGNTLPAGVTSYTVLYSTDNGSTWSQTEPPAASVTDIQWWLSDELAAGEGGNVTFQVTVPTSYTGAIVPNTGQLSFGYALPFAEDTAVTRIAGVNQIGDTVFADDGSGGGSQGNGFQDGTEAGIPGVTVSLYYDEDGDGVGDYLLETDTTDSSGNYLFTNLADGRYVVEVDPADAALPTGYAPTTETSMPVSLDVANSDPNPVVYLDADFGFSPALILEKNLTSPPPAYEGQTVTYSIEVTNAMPDGSFQPEYWATAAIAGSEFEATVADNANNILGEPDNSVNSHIIDWPDNLTFDGMVKGTGFQVGSCGAIVRVEALYQIALDGSLSNDYLRGTVQLNGTDWYNFTIDTATANSYAPPTGGGLLAVDITSSNAGHTGSVTDWATWDNAPANELQLAIGGEKLTNADRVGLLVDAIGVRITNDGSSCSSFTSDTVLNPVPLTDTYDPTKLSFVSADLPPTSVNGGTGTITWSNVGPINPGETQTINLTFDALEPTGSVAETITNTATVMNAYFVNGLPANDATDDAVTTLEPTGSIAGMVWSEGSGGSSGWIGGNGFEGVDLAAPNVTVELYGCTNGLGTLLDPATVNTNQNCTSGGGAGNNGTWELLATTTTDSNGDYLFEGLLDGFYTVLVDDATLPGTAVQTAEAGTASTNQASGGRTCSGDCDDRWGDLTQDLSLTFFNPIDTAGENITNVNFGYTVNPAIFGVIWEDSNGDGVRDTGEDDLGAGITITLTDNLGNTTTTVTLADGSYEFANLTAGNTYTVTVSAGTLPGSGWSNTADPDGTTDDQYVVGTLVAGEISGSHDFGYHQTGTAVIGDTIYYDWDGNGSQDAGDEGIPGVTVSLYEDSNGDGVLDTLNDAFITSDVTNINGNYTFSNLPAGDYIVVTEMPANTIATGDPDESGQCTVCDLHGASTGLTAGSTDDTLDFGFLPLGDGVIGDTVWLDSNGDGIQSGVQELGLANITVELMADLNGDASFDLVLTTITDANGNYLFENLPDGDYQIEVDLTDPDLPTDGIGNAYVPTTNTRYDITLSGGSYLDADFGFAPLGAIGDTIYWDANGDGEYDWNEAGIPGVVITLTNALTQTLVIDGVSYPPGAVITTTTTDGDGRYLFDALPPAEYGVTVGPIAGSPLLTGDPEADGIPCTEPTAVGCDGATTVTIDYGTNFMGADFGYQSPGAFGDYVWFDQNSDGVQDAGEIGISGVVVTATTSANVTIGGVNYPTGTTITTTTDYDGYYSFDNLISVGSSAVWTVTTDTPANMSPTYDADATADASTTVTIDTSGTITAVGGTACTDCALTVDFGFEIVGPYALTGSVCLEDDTSSNRICGDGTDQPVGSYQVYLYNDDGMYLGTTLTDPSGVYTFTNLIDDTYYVAIGSTLPPLDTADLVTTAADTPASTITENASSVYQTVIVDATTTANDGGSDPNMVEGVDFAYLSLVDFDFGDLPQSYNTTLEGNPSGPRHEVAPSPALYLGTQPPDSELNGVPDPAASSDGSDEDGVTPINIQGWTDGTDGGSVSVVVNGDGWLVGWIDFNDDGDLTDSGEMIIDQAVTTGTHTFTFDIPTGSTAGATDFYGRFRLFPVQPALSALAYTGPSSSGEVEDYNWLTSENPVIGIAKDLTDVSGNGDGSYTITYTLAVENLGDVPLQNVQVTDTLSDTFATADSYAAVNISSDLFTVNYPGYDGSSDVNLLFGSDSLALNTTAQITLTVVITPGGSLGPFNNTALASGDSPGGTPTQDTSDDGTDPDPDGEGDPDEPGENDPTPLLFAAVIGHVFEDTNGNGTQDVGEPDLPNIDVVITDVDGNTQTVTSDANGDYTAVVPAGSTTANVDETTLPTGYVQTAGTDPTTVTAVAGSTTDIGDDGYQPQGTVSGHLYIDSNGNNIQDSGEPDLANVNIIITNTFGVTQTVATDINGDWSATVPVGSTTADVDETDPQYPTGYTQTEGTDPTTVTAVAGTDTSAGNDGYYLPGTVFGHLYLDTNGNGTQDTGEPDLPNVDVIVTSSTGITQTVATDANGDWTVDVPPGSTSADVDDTDPQYPTGYTQTEGTDPTTVTAVAGSSINAGNDGYYQAGTVFGHLYIDSNGNNTQDTGEPDLANVDLIITESNGITQTVTTDANGDWSATVRPGSTMADVDETDTDYPTGYTQTEGTDPTTVTAVAGSSIDAGNDGYYLPGTVSGHLYIDTNGNGTQDAGEPNLANVDLTITDSNGITQTVTTNAGGNWTATVPPGTTTADVDDTDPDYPTGYIQTEGTDPTTVTAVAGSDTSAGIDGYHLPGTVSGHLYLDSNGNGIQDAGEPDLANVDIIITDSNGITQTVSTDANGDWMATVPPGSTTADVDETDPQYPTGYTQTEGTDPTTVTAVAGTDTSAGNDGYYLPGTVSGHLYLDTNGNGTQDAGEPNLTNVDVVITNSNGITQTVTTDANGDWIATVPPGSTTANIDETDPDYPTGSTQTEGTDPTTVTAVAGTNTPTDIDGFYLPASIGDLVWHDSNSNGIQDGGEPGLQNVTVNLYDGTGAFVTSSNTNASGIYTFTNLIPGDYYLEFVLPSGYAFTYADNSTSDLNDSDANPATGQTAVTTLTAGENDLTWDAGLYQTVRLGNRVWFDTNNNGVLDGGEQGIPNVQMELLDGTGNPVVSPVTGLPITTTTDATGRYVFDSIPPGTYMVRVAAENFDDWTDLLYGFVSSLNELSTDPAADPDGNNSDVDDNGRNNPDPANGGIVSYPVTLAVGDEPTNEGQDEDGSYANADSNLTVDFGFFELLTLGNYIWFDSNENGIINSGEFGVGGVIIYLLDGAGNPVLHPVTGQPISTTTNSSGFYQFTNLYPGEYQVLVGPENFQTGGALEGYWSSPGAVDPDNNSDFDDNGVDQEEPWLTGIVSEAVRLDYDQEPDNNDDTDDNDNTNLTIDMGFVATPTAVTLTSFTATSIGSQQVRVDWVTESEVDNFGFRLYRSSSNSFAGATQIHFEPTAVPGGSGPGASYSYTDTVPANGTYYYWLEDVETDNDTALHGPISVEVTPFFNLFLPMVIGGN